MSLALYRVYRPGRLDDVVGQEHVVEPLRRALAHDRVHHAYLFSGPRGCGKTSTARILARSLNCEQGPTPEPCGECRSCLDLAPNGPGSIDVIELDAATHRGIDDARELREKAVYAPAASRYKVYIIDEAHQLTNEAANALLKLVEEPPPHLRFVFATTEPEKIIGTIRSRTHHYAFRLVPGRVLQQHLASVCEAEGVPADPTALALIARAGGGSVRDALSILGQLAAGAGPEGITYAEAVGQLGVTDAALLDDVVDALAAGDGAGLFAVVDRVVASGHDPRRFVTDLLERLRDLVVLTAVPGAAESGLLDVPDDQLATMADQATRFGLAELSRAADLVSQGLSELRGATAPRLQLELLCARLLLPAADDASRGLAARLDRLERRFGAHGVEERAEGGGSPAEPSPASVRSASPRGSGASGPSPSTGQSTGQSPDQSPDQATDQAPPARPSAAPAADRAASPTGPGSPPPARPSASAPPPPPPLSRVAPSTAPASTPAPPAAAGHADDSAGSAAPSVPAEQETAARPSASAGQGALGAHGAPGAPGAPAEASAAGPDLGAVRVAWPQVLEALKSRKRVAWMVFGQSRPLSLSEGVLAVGVPAAGTVAGARRSGHDELLRLALQDVLGLDAAVDVVLDPDAESAAAAPSPGAAGGPARGSEGGDGDAPTRSRAAEVRAAARAAAADPDPDAEPDVPRLDDDDLDAEGLTGEDLVMRELGATRIGEIENG
ncbi:MAG: DNA polymerase III subunit gamma and tau [Candidatus Nanopelagicales bacterium]